MWGWGWHTSVALSSTVRVPPLLWNRDISRSQVLFLQTTQPLTLSISCRTIVGHTNVNSSFVSTVQPGAFFWPAARGRYWLGDGLTAPQPNHTPPPRGKLTSPRDNLHLPYPMLICKIKTMTFHFHSLSIIHLFQLINSTRCMVSRPDFPRHPMRLNLQ